MGAIGSLTGTAGGASGSGVSGPTGANVISPVTPQQTQAAYDASKNALDQQAGFTNQVLAQNGLQNQSNVYNQLQQVANGQGPNPAQAMLSQSTGANVANQAALMAGQRGSNANAGLIARQAAQQGAATQQQAVGQAATMQANQSLNALNQAGNIATNQAGQAANAVQGYNSAAQGEQSNLLNSVAGVNSANVQSQASLNAANTNLIGASQHAQAGAIGGIGSSLAGMAQGGRVSRQMYAGGGDVGIAVAPENTPGGGPKSSFGRSMQGYQTGPIQLANMTPEGADPEKDGKQVGQVLGNAMKKGAQASGVNDPSTSAGMGLDSDPLGIGSVDPSAMAPSVGTNALGGSDMAASLGGDAAVDAATDTAASGLGDFAALLANGGEAGSAIGGLLKALPMLAALAEGGKVPALVSPGEQIIPPKDVKAVAAGKKDPLSTGERVKGTPKHPGNDYRNDTVPKSLPEGAMVIPNEVMQSKNPHWGAMKFVQAHMMANGGMIQGIHSKSKKKSK